MSKVDWNAAPMVEATNVSKWYGAVIAVNDVSFQLRPGIAGLVGPNGAGKSTLIRLLTGQLRPSLGDAKIGPYDAWSAAARQWIGYCPDSDAFYEEMSGRRFVRTICRLHGFSRVGARIRTDEVLEQVGLADDRVDRKIAGYSKGMRQRIKLAQALVHDPQMIVLDEPLNGVDPVGRRELVHLFRQLAASGKVVLVSSHILEDMDRLADRILFICRGRLLASGTLEEIREMLDNYPLKVRISTVEADTGRRLAASLMGRESVQSVTLERANELVLEVDRPKQFFAEFAELAAGDDFQVERLQVTDTSTEAIFDYLLRDALHP